MFTLDKEKYKNTLLFLIARVGKGRLRGKKKLYKLLYFCDFDFFEKFGRPITGDIYRKIQMGPAPYYVEGIIHEMAKDSLLDVQTEDTGGGLKDTVVYQSNKKPDIEAFTAEELSMLERVVRLYGGKTGKQLEVLTHKEAPYLAVEEGEEIPYELSFYRGTDF